MPHYYPKSLRFSSNNLIAMTMIGNFNPDGLDHCYIVIHSFATDPFPNKPDLQFIPIQCDIYEIYQNIEFTKKWDKPSARFRSHDIPEWDGILQGVSENSNGDLDGSWVWGWYKSREDAEAVIEKLIPRGATDVERKTTRSGENGDVVHLDMCSFKKRPQYSLPGFIAELFNQPRPMKYYWWEVFEVKLCDVEDSRPSRYRISKWIELNVSAGN
ncbi:hypothetical protein N0V83_009915 [Neocucurbitaria cava]|uniref:Uncharacterized protein n=1 Tax=Neocucurbitaria cava TaxID=798079 RepID=A0A9W8Y136_9PLEO|nr:hypothetical protein N0V83_009915 [Neocucurbitaria cava]